MSLSIGIVGLPNVGKSTTFNALTEAQNAEVANYPFCTIEPNRAIVAVPDERIEKVGELVNQPNVIHATIEFDDIAGLDQVLEQPMIQNRHRLRRHRYIAALLNEAKQLHALIGFDHTNPRRLCLERFAAGEFGEALHARLHCGGVAPPL